ncbi:hypothetical protein C8R45DRAFT_924229 [Mycena sanguinolenta]|nr:hypothetical protein C8R45DRAFT_924229 [Mycena sanguinolenta]
MPAHALRNHSQAALRSVQWHRNRDITAINGARAEPPMEDGLDPRRGPAPAGRSPANWTFGVAQEVTVTSQSHGNGLYRDTAGARWSVEETPGHGRSVRDSSMKRQNRVAGREASDRSPRSGGRRYDRLWGSLQLCGVSTNDMSLPSVRMESEVVESHGEDEEHVGAPPRLVGHRSRLVFSGDVARTQNGSAEVSVDGQDALLVKARWTPYQGSLRGVSTNDMSPSLRMKTQELLARHAKIASNRRDLKVGPAASGDGAWTETAPDTQVRPSIQSDPLLRQRWEYATAKSPPTLLRPHTIPSSFLTPSHPLPHDTLTSPPPPRPHPPPAPIPSPSTRAKSLHGGPYPRGAHPRAQRGSGGRFSPAWTCLLVALLQLVADRDVPQDAREQPRGGLHLEDAVQVREGSAGNVSACSDEGNAAKETHFENESIALAIPGAKPTPAVPSARFACASPHRLMSARTIWCTCSRSMRVWVREIKTRGHGRARKGEGKEGRGKGAHLHSIEQQRTTARHKLNRLQLHRVADIPEELRRVEPALHEVVDASAARGASQEEGVGVGAVPPLICVCGVLILEELLHGVRVVVVFDRGYVEVLLGVDGVSVVAVLQVLVLLVLPGAGAGVEDAKNEGRDGKERREEREGREGRASGLYVPLPSRRRTWRVAGIGGGPKSRLECGG